MLVYRTIAKKVFSGFDSTIMQNLSDILPLFCTPTWPSHQVSENQELLVDEHSLAKGAHEKSFVFVHQPGGYDVA